MTHWAKMAINAASFFVLLPFLVVLLRYRVLSPAMRPVACYVLLSGLVQALSSYLNSFSINNLWLLHLYTPLEFFCISWFFSKVLEGLVPRRVFVGAAIGFMVLSALNSLFLQDVNTFNTYARSLEGVLVVILCLGWCYRTLSEMKIQRLEKDPVFWVNTGFLLYFSGNVLLFAFSNYILPLQKSLNLYVWAFHGLLNILLNAFIALGLWIRPAKHT